MEAFFVLATWLDVMAISACAGILACCLWVMPRHAPGHFHQRLWAGLGAALALLTAASAVLLVARTLEFSGAPFASLPTDLPLVLQQTQYGHIWQVRMAAVGVLWLCWLGGGSRSLRPVAAPVSMLALLVVVFSRSATGHAGDQGIYSGGVWVDCLHVWSSGIWVGSLFAMSLLVFPLLLRQVEIERALAAEVFARLSRVATLALAAIVASGIYNAWGGLDGIGDLWQSRYGQILSVKVALVIWMVYLGGHNRYHKVPALQRWVGMPTAPASFWQRVPGWRPLSATRGGAYLLSRCARAVHLEAALGVLVLAAAALLHHGMPPADMRHMGYVPATPPTLASMPVRGVGRV